MATITLTMATDAGPSFTRTLTTTDAVLQRLFDAYKGELGTPASTPGEVATLIFRDAMHQLRKRTLGFERRQAAEAVGDIILE